MTMHTFHTVLKTRSIARAPSLVKDLCYGLPLAARTLAEITSQNSQNFERTSPPYSKSEDKEKNSFGNFAKFPVLVFIDMYDRQQGKELIRKFCDLLPKKQVFGVQLGEPNMYNNPETVLKDVYGTLEKLKQNGYYGLASAIQRKMRIIVVGGDDVVNWILGVICDFKLQKSPSIAPVPPPTLKRESLWVLDTYQYGIAASFGWKDILNISPLQSFLVDVALAKSWRTDSWSIRMKRPPHPFFMGPLPHYLHEVGDVGKADNPTLYGRFWHYFRLAVHNDGPSSGDDLTKIAIVKVLNHHDQWEMLHIPESTNSIHCLNFPIFPQREDHRFIDDTWKDEKNTCFIDDGRLEVVGSKYDKTIHFGRRSLLNQVRGIRFEFINGAGGSVSISIDGGPEFKIHTHPLVEIEISYHGQVNILAGPDCEAKSIHLSSQSSVSQANAKD